MGLSSKLSCEAGSFSCHCNPYRFFQSEVLSLYFPTLEPWVACLSWFPAVPPGLSACKCRTGSSASPCHAQSFSATIYHESSLLCCPSLPLLPVWMNVSLTPWLLAFHTVQFSGSFGYFLFLNLLSFFSLCKEVKCIYLCLHLGWKFMLIIIYISIDL